MIPRRPTAPVAALTLLMVAAAAGSAAALHLEPAAPSYEREVRPILVRRCYACHSRQVPVPQGGLLLDSAAGWRRGGTSGPAVIPGHPEKSLLIQAVRYDGTRKMPPAGRLPEAEVALLTRWVAAGAPGGPKDAGAEDPARWWAFRPLRLPPLPRVRQLSWCRTPIDRFVLAKLEAKGLRPSPPADRRTLIRRATFDLTGLPPTPAEVRAFLADRSVNAYEKVVDRLLASPRYGERWGRHWLDVAHYADTHGYDKDKRRDHAWPYRDYVIRSFNADKPYARFMREQIAGDVLFPDDPEGIVATGFIAAGPWDFVGQVELREGTTDKNITRVLDRDDMVMTTMSTFVSMTAHCARCHDHKFDPISQEDYYSLQAVFAGVDRADRPYDLDPRVHAARRPLLERRRALMSQLRPLLDRA